jgi:hypothetical protein
VVIGTLDISLAIIFSKVKGVKRELLNLEPTLCPNIIVLAVSPLCRGDGPIVMTSEVLAVPVKTLDVKHILYCTDLVHKI